MSRYQPNYDSNESRRSPRDQSPGRYNDSRDDSRGGAFRGGERRRSSIPDARMNHNANTFASNRDLFAARDSSRDFSSREPPRGPKGVLDAPTGPRASGYDQTFGGYRGDRDRGRGRGRGGPWRDDSRDRDRNIERDYRDRRDDRGPPFRENLNRERWGREGYKGGRRAPSPQGRARSPGYNPRESRDARDIPPTLDIDRSRRESRDGPSSGGSPHSETTQTFSRGFGRGRGGGRGRGRGGFYEESHHRQPGRSRSPENGWSRRTQPSATPPPEVPAFGSSANSIPLGPSIPTGPAAATPLPGIAVPTAPRSDRPPERRPYAGKYSNSLIIDNSRRELIGPPKISASPTTSKHPPLISPNSPKSIQTTESKDYSQGPSAQPSPLADQKPSPRIDRDHEPPVKLEATPANSKPTATADRTPKNPPRRRPIVGKRPPKLPKQTRQEIPDAPSDSDSEDDDFSDEYFEKEIRKIQGELDTLTAQSYQNPLLPRPEPDMVFLQPFMDSMIDDIIIKVTAAEKEPCIPHEHKTAVPETPRSAGLAPKAKPKGKSRPSTPLIDKTPIPSPRPINGQLPAQAHDILTNGSNSRRSPSLVPRPPSYSEIGDEEDDDAESLRAVSNGAPVVELLPHELEAVRKRMPTPPISTLPNFGNKKWYEDESCLKDLESRPEIESRIYNNIMSIKADVQMDQEEEARAWVKRYKAYRMWTDIDNDPIAVRSRDKFKKSRDAKAAEVAAPNRSVLASAGNKHEGSRRTGIRFATERDLERVLQQSAREAKESKEREERESRANTANAKEAVIPDMIWDPEEKARNLYIDRSRLIPFERSFAVMEFGEPIDNFSREEMATFEKMYLDNPKEWGKIATALPDRDYKTCIQHYYLIKHTSKLKEKLKELNKVNKRRRPVKKVKTIGLVADAEDTQEVEKTTAGRPKRAAAPTFNFEAPASENGSEVASPAPPPSRKRNEAGRTSSSYEPSPVKRKTKTPREKGPKQPKSSQLLAAAPASNRMRAESPATPIPSTEWNSRRESSVPVHTPRFAPVQFDGASATQAFPAPFPTLDRSNPSLSAALEATPQPFSPQERLESVPPMSLFDTDRNKSLQQPGQQTSSYWSVPEQTDFPALLRHFGTDWNGISKHMTSKTHIMVYTARFHEWFKPSVDKTLSRRVANHEKQVKNYYQRQVDSGKFKEYEEIAKQADEKRARGESTGAPPPPIIIPKRRYDVTPGLAPRSGSVMDAEDILSGATSSMLAHASPPQPQSLSARFPALAQAGPVPQIPSSASSVLGKHMTPQPIQQAPPTSQPPSRAPRGPTLGFFNNDPPQRPTLQSDAVSQRSLMVAQEAQMEQQSALREQQRQAQIREQNQMRDQKQQQQLAFEREREVQRQIRERDESIQREAIQREQIAMQRERNERERNLPLKQENEMNSVQQYEPYPAQHAMHTGNPQPQRFDGPKPITPSVPESRRSLQAQQYQPRPQGVRTAYGDSSMGPREIRSSPSPAAQRNPMSGPSTSQESYAAPRSVPPPAAPVAAVRQQETVRKTSNIMSLLNDDPSDTQPTPPKRVSDVASAPQSSRTPPPPHALQAPRYPAHIPQSASHIPPSMTAQSTLQQHSYTTPSHPLHQHSSSLSQPRSYTPTSYENRERYAPPPLHTQQQMYSPAPPRHPLSAQPPLRREHSAGDAHGMSSGYSRTPASTQSASRLKESPYSATAAPSPIPRQPASGSPHDGSYDDWQKRQHLLYLAQHQQQQQVTSGSPQQGPAYSTSSPSTHHAQQQQPPNHRQFGFGSAPSHAASPPPQFSSQHSLHRSRHNSVDGRSQMSTITAPAPTNQGYAQAPQPQGTPLSMQYPQQAYPSHNRHDNPFERDRERAERERRLEGENYLRLRGARDPREREMEEQRRLEESRR